MASTLEDYLRALPDEALGALLQLRPDLVVPVPPDISSLAARARSRTSVTQALDQLDHFTLEMLDGLRMIRSTDGTASTETLLTLATDAGASPVAVQTAVGRLRARFLVYGPEHALRLLDAIDEVCSPFLAGLGRAAADLDDTVAALVNDPARLRRTLLAAPPDARAVLDRLAAGPPIGRVRTGSLQGAAGPDAPADAPVAADSTTNAEVTAESPVRWLIANRLVAVIADDLVELPREVGLLLRRETGPLGKLHPDPPPVEATPRDPEAVDSAGAGQALEAVRHLDAILADLVEDPAPVLKSGGLGVRDLRRLARQNGVDEPTAAMLVEVGYTTGLLAPGEPPSAGRAQRSAVRDAGHRWLPTATYDTWRAAPLAQRWAMLARGWLAMPRDPALVGQRDDKERLVNALAPEVSRRAAPAVRRAALRVLADLPEGAGPDPDAVLARLAWQAPRRARFAHGPQALVRSVLVEAATLGVIGFGALTGYGRLLLDEAGRDVDEDPLGLRPDATGSMDALTKALDRLLPSPVDHVLVQADLTVVVPGPPAADLAAELALIAQAESRGGATVYRVTPDSVRRALDAGYTSADIHSLFRRRSRTPLPQSLSYLIDDVGRRHGGLRLGSAGAYLRSDDEALLAEVAADRRLGGLALRRLSPTVLATPYHANRLLTALREAGYAPVPEDASGAAVLTRPKELRAPRPTSHPVRLQPAGPGQLSGPRLAAVVEQLRTGDRLIRAARRAPLARSSRGEGATPATVEQVHGEALAVLQQALRDRARVWVGYVNAHGTPTAKLVRPVSMGAGYLRAEDDRTETLHTFALHRITSAALDE